MLTLLIVYDVRIGTLLMKPTFVSSTVPYPNLTFGHATKLKFEAYFVNSF